MKFKSWSDITTEMYQKIHPICISEDYESDLDKVIDIALLLYDTNINNVEMSKLKDLMFLLQPESIPNLIPRAFNFKGKIYKPSLEIQKIKGGQYIDLTSYTKEQDKIISNLHYLLAIMCTEVNWFGFRKKYTADRMMKRAELFKQLPITITYPLCVFFCQNLQNSIQTTQSYLAEQATKQVNELNHLLTPTDGL